MSSHFDQIERWTQHRRPSQLHWRPLCEWKERKEKESKKGSEIKIEKCGFKTGIYSFMVYRSSWDTSGDSLVKQIFHIGENFWAGKRTSLLLSWIKSISFIISFSPRLVFFKYWERLKTDNDHPHLKIYKKESSSQENRSNTHLASASSSSSGLRVSPRHETKSMIIISLTYKSW